MVVSCLRRNEKERGTGIKEVKEEWKVGVVVKMGLQGVGGG